MNKIFQSLGGVLTKAAKGVHMGIVNSPLKGHAGDAVKATTHMKWQGVFLAHTLFFSRGTPEEKMHTASAQVGMFLLTAGMKSSTRQAFWQTALSIAPHFPDMGRGLVQGYRGVLEARTMASVPFSYSSLAQDQAFASMQYSQGRLADANSMLTGQAAYLAARYLQR